MESADQGCGRDREVEEPPDIQGPSKEFFQESSSRVRSQEQRMSIIAQRCERHDSPIGFKFSPKVELTGKTLQSLGVRRTDGSGQYQDRDMLVLRRPSATAIKPKFPFRVHRQSIAQRSF